MSVPIYYAFPAVVPRAGKPLPLQDNPHSSPTRPEMERATLPDMQYLYGRMAEYARQGGKR